MRARGCDVRKRGKCIVAPHMGFIHTGSLSPLLSPSLSLEASVASLSHVSPFNCLFVVTCRSAQGCRWYLHLPLQASQGCRQAAFLRLRRAQWLPQGPWLLVCVCVCVCVVCRTRVCVYVQSYTRTHPHTRFPPHSPKRWGRARFCA
jgi:hypothetical protein